MKRHLSRIFSCLFVAILFASQSPMVLAAQDDVGVVQGRVVNVSDPIDEQDAATKKYVDNLIDGIPELPAVLQSTGKSETAVMSQKAVTSAVNASQDSLISELNENKIPIVTTTGSNTDLIATVPDWEVSVGKMIVIIPHVTGTSNAVTLNVNNDGAKQFTCLDSSGASGNFASTAPVVTAGSPILVARGNTQWHVLNISKPNVNSVNGVLSITNGGTGASTNTDAVSNLGMTFATGTWTPVLANNGGTNPTYTASYSNGLWRRIDFGDFHLMFISLYVTANITNVGSTSNYAIITGLPRSCYGDAIPLAVVDCSNMASGAPNTMQVNGGSSSISIRESIGLGAVKWQTGTTYLRAAGCYVCSAS